MKQNKDYIQVQIYFSTKNGEADLITKKAIKAGFTLPSNGRSKVEINKWAKNELLKLPASPSKA